MNISFAWTTGALLWGDKDVTRRYWPERYAMQCARLRNHTAVDKVTFAGGKVVAKIEVVDVAQTSIEALILDPDRLRAEWQREGGAWYWPTPEDFVKLFLDGKKHARGAQLKPLWRVELRLGELTDHGKRLREELARGRPA